jgi:hypothetical protein
MHIFYYRLQKGIRNLLDASFGGNFLNHDVDSASELFEGMVENSINNTSMSQFTRGNSHQNPHPKSHQKGIHEIGNQSSSIDLEIIAKKLDKVDIIAKHLDEVRNTMKTLTPLLATQNPTRLPISQISLGREL